MSEEVKPQLPFVRIDLADPVTFNLKVEAQVPNIDVALNMLQQTIRVLEAERRKQEALDFQAEQQQRMMDVAVEKQLRRRPS